MRLKVDENLGRSAVDLLRQAGHDIRSVIDEGLQGTPDRSLIETCRVERRCLVTLDLEFGNPILFPPADFAGIAVLRPDRPTEKTLARTLETLIAGLESEQIAGKLWIPRVLEYRDRSRDRFRLDSTRYSASARICRKYSRGSKDILRLGQDVRTDVGAQGLGRDQFNPPSQNALQQFAQLEEAVKALLAGTKLDQQVHVAVRLRLAADDGAEERQTPYAEALDLALGILQTLDDVISGDWGGDRAGKPYSYACDSATGTGRPSTGELQSGQ